MTDQFERKSCGDPDELAAQERWLRRTRTAEAAAEDLGDFDPEGDMRMEH
jgi:hypothetical protein